LSLELIPTTEKEAVNEMLSAIGETPVSSLDDDSVVDAETARAILRSVSRQVQSKGLHCNTDKGIRISPNNAGEIIIPPNALEVDEITPVSGNRDLVVRGRKLYDRENHTYKINTAVTLDIVSMLPFEELPQNTRAYITIRAARIFHDRTLGDEALHRFTEGDEMEAKRQFTRSQIKNRDANMLRNRHSQAILNRRVNLS